MTEARALSASGAGDEPGAGGEAGAGGAAGAGGEAGAGGAARRYERGVVFYVRERRVVGVLLWNLFNRMHVARQVRTVCSTLSIITNSCFDNLIPNPN